MFLSVIWKFLSNREYWAIATATSQPNRLSANSFNVLFKLGGSKHQRTFSNSVPSSMVTQTQMHGILSGIFALEFALENTIFQIGWKGCLRHKPKRYLLLDITIFTLFNCFEHSKLPKVIWTSVYAFSIILKYSRHLLRIQSNIVFLGSVGNFKLYSSIVNLHHTTYRRILPGQGAYVQNVFSF